MLYLTPPQVKNHSLESWTDGQDEINLKGRHLMVATTQLTLLLSVVWGLLLSCL